MGEKCKWHESFGTNKRKKGKPRNLGIQSEQPASQYYPAHLGVLPTFHCLGCLRPGIREGSKANGTHVLFATNFDLLSRCM